MNLATIDVPATVAEDALAEYERAIRTERNTQDEAIAMGYRALARGQRLISLSKTIEAGGWFEDTGLPRIAVGQATETECRVSWSGDSLYFFHTDWNRSRGALVGSHSVRVPIASPPDVKYWQRKGGHTIMPLIPPRHRPKPRRLKHCHILWEVESWTMVPPHDPALIRHVRGDLWIVLAEWDLTELERAVLGAGL